jgi:hypothetical protein
VDSSIKLELKTLKTFGVKPDGEVIELNFVDPAGIPVCFQMTFAHAQSIAMMLLGLLTDVLRKNVGTDKSRYAFPLGSWWIESADKSGCLIATFATKDGFEVSFAILRDMWRVEPITPSENVRHIRSIDNNTASNTRSGP